MDASRRCTGRALRVLLYAIVCWECACVGARADPPTAIVVALDGAIGPATAAYVVHNLDEAARRERGHRRAASRHPRRPRQRHARHHSCNTGLAGAGYRLCRPGGCPGGKCWHLHPLRHGRSQRWPRAPTSGRRPRFRWSAIRRCPGAPRTPAEIGPSPTEGRRTDEDHQRRRRLYPQPRHPCTAGMPTGPSAPCARRSACPTKRRYASTSSTWWPPSLPRPAGERSTAAPWW